VPVVFSRSVRSIETDGYRRSGLVLALAFALTAGWTGWFVFARVAVIEVAETARLEVDQAAHGIEAAVGGRVTSSHLVLGQDVQAGDVLVELDAEPLRLTLGEEKAKQSAFAPQIAALGQEIAAEERALEEQRRVTQARVDEADARRREAETAAGLAETEAKRAARLFAENLASESDAVKAKADAEQKRAAADGTKLATTRIEAEQRAGETERRARLARLRADLAQLEGQKAMSAAAIQQLEYEIERRQIRAPIAGRLGEVALVRAGGVVKEGERLGAVIPAGQIRVVAEFLPAAAIGRIRAGQSARMRPEGFPWTQYGVLEATVRRVANEPRSGRIRVELDVVPKPDSRIPMQHGLPGTLEIQVERASPASLVFRAAGRRLAAPARDTETRSDGVEGQPQTPAGP
jgi:membrane fusion protein (multidrug efflux system)